MIESLITLNQNPRELASQVINGECIFDYGLKAEIFHLSRFLKEPELISRPDNKPLSIALVIPYHPLDEVGGLEIGTMSLANELRDLGQNVIIVSRGIYPHTDFSGEFKTPESIPVFGAGEGIKDISRFILSLSLVDQIDIIQWMEIFPPVPEEPQVYNINAEIQYLTSVLLRALGKRTFLYVATSGNVTSRGINNTDWLPIKTHQPLNALIKKGMTGINAINPDIFKEFCANGINFADYRQRYLPFGVDTELFTHLNSVMEKKQLREGLGLPQDKIIFYFLGRFVARKRPSLLLEQWKTLPEELRRKAHLLFIGGKAAEGQPDSIYGPTKATILSEINRQKVEGNKPDITVIDFVPHDKLPDYIRASDVFVFPSSREGLGLVALEALACGKPVIAFAIEGVKEVVNDKVGILLDADHPNLLGTTLANLIKNPTIIFEKSQTNREYVLNKWSWEAVAKNFLDFYKSFI